MVVIFLVLITIISQMDIVVKLISTGMVIIVQLLQVHLRIVLRSAYIIVKVVKWAIIYHKEYVLPMVHIIFMDK